MRRGHPCECRSGVDDDVILAYSDPGVPIDICGCIAAADVSRIPAAEAMLGSSLLALPSPVIVHEWRDCGFFRGFASPLKSVLKLEPRVRALKGGPMHADHLPASSGVQPSGAADVPAAPVVKPDEIWSGTPNVLVDGSRYALGWQGWPEKKGSPGFVIARRGSMGTLKVMERYPLTDEGWAKAWQALVKVDPAMTKRIRLVLARRAEEDSGFAERRALDARSLSYVPRVIFIGGYSSGTELAAGDTYELRFLEDRLSVFRPGSLQALAEFGYADVQAVEVAGPGLVRKWSPGQQAMLTAAFGVTGALVGYGSTRIKTFVRVQSADAELFFLDTEMLPEDLRIHISRGLGAVREAQGSAACSGDDYGQPRSASLADELSRLAGLLEKGLLTREEFDQLKARLIAGQ